jgi:hypothetical protein
MVKGNQKPFCEAYAETIAGIIAAQYLDTSSATYVQITDQNELDALLAMLQQSPAELVQ